jgi:DNA-binding NarL/FixJ family response regulator
MSNSRTTPFYRSRVLIVDDHPIVRQGYAFIIGTEDDLQVCGSASCEVEAIEQVRSTSPDLVIVDIMLENGSGIELVKRLARDYTEARTLVISAHDELIYAERALDAGAAGYLNKNEATDCLIDAMRQVLRDEVYLSDRMTKRILHQKIRGNHHVQQSPLAVLSDRELHVFRLIGQGMATRHIAQELSLSPRTIERYRENIKQKLNLRSATQLVQSATKWVLDAGG